ncbi:hypothetical protein VNO78_01033 [Psophocarpus tetragonolobus]|uniref:protein-disulfide reductase n=1 Tax=Psophocarpus tetragonolobus TaxID=3891 RepID=A0AAN9SXY8_PSOTE
MHEMLRKGIDCHNARHISFGLGDSTTPFLSLYPLQQHQRSCNIQKDKLLWELEFKVLLIWCFGPCWILLQNSYFSLDQLGFNKVYKRRERLFYPAPMAGLNFEATYTDNHDILKIFAAEGVEFLLSCEGKVHVSECNGKIICLYFSANWCRPCRAFIPRLVELYETLGKRRINLEVIFISFDRDEDGFKEHFKSMPWLAIPFDVNLHRRLIDRYRVDRIPSFVPLCSDGITVEEDLVGYIEDYGADAFPFTRKRLEELKAIDERKREDANLEELLGHEGRNFLISGDDRKVPISELAGKTIGLYFCAYWSPPCCTFTVQLTDAYNNLKAAKGDCFEIVLISTDRDLKEFNVNKSSMPWLAVPYEERTRHDLRRIFGIKGIPALVLIGPDGKVISVNGKFMVSSYGAEAFPFTESRIRDLEAALIKEGEALPQQVEDVNHEHILKLDMAKAYVCDSCKKHGKFWTFSCDVCDYDLHPSCLEKVEKD